MEVKVINLEKETKEVIVFDGLDGPCLSVAISSNALLLSAASGDGKLRIWNIETKSLLKDITCFPKVNSFANAKLLCKFFLPQLFIDGVWFTSLFIYLVKFYYARSWEFVNIKKKNYDTAI